MEVPTKTNNGLEPQEVFSLNLSSLNEKVLYFILKTKTYESIKISQEQGIWRVPIRKQNIQPFYVLNLAFEKGKTIIFIFSVTNTKKWLGYAEMKSKVPEVNYLESNEKGSSQLDSSLSPPFDIKWINYLDNIESGRGVPFSETEGFLNPYDDNKTVNLSRNLQQVDSSIAQKLCVMIDNEVEKEKEEKRMKENSIPKPQPFFQKDETHETQEELWKGFLNEVGKVGKVLFAGHVGSRSYNLHIPTSDIDMLVVVAAPSEDIMSFIPLIQTKKNPEGFEPDFTLHEVSSFLELLLKGDTRIVESLFQSIHSIVYESEEFKFLKQQRLKFLTKQTLHKYLNEIHGPKGFKQLLNSNKSPKDEQEKIRLYKKWYVLHRLLHHAKQITLGNELEIWMEEANPVRKFLLDIRKGVYSFEELLKMANKTEMEIQKNLQTSSLPDSSLNEKPFLEKWLLNIRYQNWITPPHLSSLFQKNSNLPSLDWSQLKGGDPLFITKLENQYCFGLYVAPSDIVLSNFQTVTHVYQINDIPFYEIGHFCKEISASNPNFIWALYTNPLFESPAISYFKQHPELFLCKRVVERVCASIRNPIERTEQGKKTHSFQYDRFFPVLWLLQQFFQVYHASNTNKNKKVVQFKVQLNEVNPQQLAKEMIKEAIEIKLEEGNCFSSSISQEKLIEWIQNVRKTYLQR